VNRAFKQILGFVLAGAFLSLAVHAEEIITSLGPGYGSASGGNNTLGYDFSVGSSTIALTYLGVWDEHSDGLTNAHTVGLWDDAGTLLASVDISAGTAAPLIDGFRYAALSIPVTLLPGETYVLGASYVTADADRVIVNFSGNQAGFDDAIVSGGLRYVTGAGFDYPEVDAGSGSEIGPNALFLVPEPSSLALALTSFGLALAWIGRRKLGLVR
jgi:hypothetical protein